MLLLGKYVQKDHSSTRTQTKWEEEKKRQERTEGERAKKKGTMGSSAQAIKTEFRILTNNLITRSPHSSIP